MNLSALIEALMYHEHTVVNVYQKFDDMFRRETNIFGQLFDEEVRHERKYKEIAALAVELPGNGDFSIEIELIMQFCTLNHKTWEIVTAENTTLACALNFAIEMEETLAESTLFYFFEERQGREPYTALYRLLQDEKQHKKMLLEVYNTLRGPYEHKSKDLFD